MRYVILFTLFVTAIFDVNANSSAEINANDLTLKISISQSQTSSPWSINYEFSEPISAMSFENTPYSFIKRDWILKTEHSQKIDFSELQFELNGGSRRISLDIKSENDQFIRGFYTPFLNFSDGSNAIFLGHYLPTKVHCNGKWINVESLNLFLSINTLNEENVLFSGSDNISDLPVAPQDLRQYAYVGKSNYKHFGKFNVIVDPTLPPWIKKAYYKAIPEIYQYYEHHTHSKLIFEPLFIVNFNSGDMKPRQDGGVINKQVAINFVGDDWQKNPEANMVNVLSLLAHEMAHLWNSQHWSLDNNKQVWMLEGGANYFAKNALLGLGYISKKSYRNHFRVQAKKCIKALNHKTMANLTNRADAYVCGEVIYYLTSQMLNGSNSLENWNNMASRLENDEYDEDDFIRALKRAKVNDNELAIVEETLRGKNSENFINLIDKYINI